jgi:hypothetical protein
MARMGTIGGSIDHRVTKIPPGDPMLSLSHVLNSAAPRSQGRDNRLRLTLIRVIVLVLVVLLPVQMRAGAADPHPHALLQLIIDARDGTVDHHADIGHDDAYSPHVNIGGSHEHDGPTLGVSHPAGSGIAMLVALVAVFLVPAADVRLSWLWSSRWCGRTPALDPPPPRVGCI